MEHGDALRPREAHRRLELTDTPDPAVTPGPRGVSKVQRVVGERRPGAERKAVKMSIATTIVVLATAAWVGFSAFSVYTRKSWVVDNFVDYEVPRSWWFWLGSAKALGAIGLVVGMWIPSLAVAAAIGLVLYFLGAVVTVMRARAYRNVPFPMLYLAPVVAAGLMTASV